MGKAPTATFLSPYWTLLGVVINPLWVIVSCQDSIPSPSKGRNTYSK